MSGTGLVRFGKGASVVGDGIGGTVCRREGSAGRGGAGIREEDPADAAAGDRVGSATRRGEIEMSTLSELHERWSQDPEYREGV